MTLQKERWVVEPVEGTLMGEELVAESGQGSLSAGKEGASGAAQGMSFTREQLQAAYALNLCTVSVMQILAYNDMGVLEQEYDSILNNLNFENMPGDEALLQILKRILETIAYFRVEESEKEFIEKEYQQKMKNAIWTAVPNLALLVAGANPVSMGVSLASQVGIGYMNYRKNRSTYVLEKDRQMWKLKRSAMEQLEGLTQQLFETAWRLADVYEFPDVFRLSQRQIRHYNQVLMDTDEVRKYERLDSIRSQFAAYPPFWYYFGNTANAIARNPDLPLNEAEREQYRERARRCFAYFYQFQDANLLREDEITAACCLEYADLLDPEREREKILSLVDTASRFAGSFWDVRELCAMAYLKNQEYQKATREFKILVNEGINGVVNAQILSSIYVKQYIEASSQGDKKGAREAGSDYRLLSTRVGEEFLFPLPEPLSLTGPLEEEQKNPQTLQEAFLDRERKVLRRIYMLVLQNMEKKFELAFNKIVPLPREDYGQEAKGGYQQEREEAEELYLDTQESRKMRMEKVKLALDGRDREGYRQEVYSVSYIYQVMSLCNQLFACAVKLECVQDEMVRQDLLYTLRADVHSHRESLREAEARLKDLDVEGYRQVMDIRLRTLAGGFLDKLARRVELSIDQKDEMADFAILESSLIRFCRDEGIDPPDILYEKRHEVKEGETQELYITPDLLGEDAVRESRRRERGMVMMDIIQEMMEQVVIDKEQVEFYTQEDVRMNRYFYNKALQAYTGIRYKTLAVLDDRSRHDYDLMFTLDGVIPVIRGKVRNPIAYNEVCWSNNGRKKELKTGLVKFSSDSLDMDALHELIQRLGEL